ncbi:galactokinase [Tissierella sp. MSJ-40]|uniref:Galactokinase n=1 Tax=Tissierella simiarum TaxID=2841534 RepID=A0ABS6E2M9_9FIRM|nr:galactokinase [Tissierella simiarum]MBU5436690.1 galactokinase [Tissierella simiarum]
MDLLSLKSRFFQLYGNGEVSIFFSPSRVNLIGEHIDYNGGYVMPCALQLGTYGLVRKRDDGNVRLISKNFDLKIETHVNDLKYKEEHGWGNYPKGVLYYLKKAGYKVSGMDILIKGNIPNGAGLSSSASLELLIGQIVNSLFNEGKISSIELIKICQRAENEFIGVKCGIMDQFAIAMGKKDKGILLDCHTLYYEYIDMNLRDYTLVIMNTNKRRELNDSKYNKRREECEIALNIVRRYKNIENLCQLTIEEYNELELYIEDETIRNRAKHAVYENGRVLEACEVLKKGDIKELGKLLVQSHNSLKDLYEVTGVELDTIVEEAIAYEDCIGARMTGAGFGGCAIAFVKEDKVEDFINKVGQTYKNKIGYEASFYITGIGDGTRELSLE